MKIILPNTSLVAVILLILLFSHCSDGPTNGVVELEECNSDLSVSVSSGIIPIITWEPECKAFLLGVLNRDATPIDMWRIGALGNKIPSGVKYGILPDGALLIIEPRGLVSGVEYEAMVYWANDFNGDLEDTAIWMGPFTQLFTP